MSVFNCSSVGGAECISPRRVPMSSSPFGESTSCWMVIRACCRHCGYLTILCAHRAPPNSRKIPEAGRKGTAWSNVRQSGWVRWTKIQLLLWEQCLKEMCGKLTYLFYLLYYNIKIALWDVKKTYTYMFSRLLRGRLTSWYSHSIFISRISENFIGLHQETIHWKQAPTGVWIKNAQVIEVCTEGGLQHSAGEERHRMRKYGKRNNQKHKISNRKHQLWGLRQRLPSAYLTLSPS